jgi:DNA invertase Pin-like site-specific DNA recombinase
MVRVKKVIELIRVSTAAQAGDDRASIPSQTAANRRTAEIYGLSIAKSIQITDVSGAAVLRAPEMQELLRLIAAPDIHGVVVREFSRVMRPDNFADYVLFQAFQDTGTLLYLPDGPLDLNTKTGKLVAGLRAIIAGNELSEIRERIWSAKESNRRAGKHTQSSICLPFGVGYTNQQGFFYKPEAERVRDVYRRLLAGETNYVELSKVLGFTGQGIRIVLMNPIYMGWRVYEQKRDIRPGARRCSANGRQGDRPKIRREAEEIIRVKVIDPPLVTEDEWKRAQEIVAMKRRRHWRHRSEFTPQFTYNGFLVCSDCDSTIYGQNGRRFYYVCSQRLKAHCDSQWMRRERLEEKLDGMFAEKFTDRKFITDLLGDVEARSDAAAARGRVVRLETEIKSLRAKRSRILDGFFEGLLGREERDQRLADVDSRMRLVEERLLREAPLPKVTARSLMAAFAPLFDWQYLNRESKRRILAATVPEIHVSNYSVRGVSVTSPSFFIDNGTRSNAGYHVADEPFIDIESRIRAASVIAETPTRLFIPLNL